MMEPLIENSDKSKLCSRKYMVSIYLQTLFIKVVSGICGFFFIGFIFIFSIFHYMYHMLILRDHKYTESEIDAYPIAKPKSSGNLRYYAQLVGLELDQYKVTTSDGFIIILQRLYNPNNNSATLNSKKPILLIHGLLQSSGSFLTSGYKSLAYYLVQNNYDVWMGNNRCGFDPQHIIYSNDDPKMWNWDLNEMARYDIPAMIQELCKIKKYNGKVSMITHSQGTTQCVFLFSKQFNSEFLHNVDKCVLLAPAVYGGSLLNEKLFIKFMRFIPDPVYNLFFGTNSFMPILMHLRYLTYRLPSFGFASYAVFSYLFDWNDYLWDKNLRSIHFIFSPVYVSVKLMKWWLRSKNGQGFEQDKPIISDPNSWFTNDTPDLFLVIGGKDHLVNGQLFMDRLANIENKMVNRWNYMKIEDYSHLDVLWADDLLDRIGDKLLEFLD